MATTMKRRIVLLLQQASGQVIPNHSMAVEEVVIFRDEVKIKIDTMRIHKSWGMTSRSCT